MTANEASCDEKEEIEIVESLEKFGKYQKMQYLYTCLPAVFMTMLHINYIFVVADVNYRCRIPECDEQFPVYSASWWPNRTIDRCSKPKLDPGALTCTNTSFTDTFEICTDWVYETNNSAICELNLACQPWKSNLIGTIHNVGMLFAMITSGWMTDKFGRKPTLIFSAVGTCIGHLKAFTTSYYIYVLVEMVEAFIAGGAYTAAMVLMIEIGGKKSRILSGVLFAYAVDVGESLFAGIAMFVPYWKNLVRIIYTPSIIFLSLIFLLKESPRWQILNGKTESAKKAILHITEVNKININKTKLKNMTDEELKSEFKMNNYGQKEKLINIFKSKEIIKIVLVSAFCRFSASFIYYGLMVNSVYLPGNKYTNFMLATVMSYPGELMSMFLMNKVGRKIPLIYGYIFCGLLCVGSGWVPEDYTWLKIVLFLFGKLVVSLCYTGVITYTMELFPTSVRGTLLGTCSLTSSVGSMLAPLTPILNSVSVILPPMFFGGFAIISGALLTQMPETKDLPLMDTIEQVDRAERPDTNREKDNGEINYAFNKDISA